jgi:hypothetical protein
MLRRWAQAHPFATAVVVLLTIVVPALLRQEYIADEAHKAAVSAEMTATAFYEAEQREDAEETGEAVNACRVRNRGTLNDRLRFDALFDTLERIFPDEPAVDELRAAVPADPGIEDRDCDGDGVLTGDDYAP